MEWMVADLSVGMNSNQKHPEMEQEENVNPSKAGIDPVEEKLWKCSSKIKTCSMSVRNLHGRKLCI